MKKSKKSKKSKTCPIMGNCPTCHRDYADCTCNHSKTQTSIPKRVRQKNREVELSSEDFANNMMDQFAKDKRITHVHRTVLAISLLLSAGLQPEFKLLRAGKLVQVKSDGIKLALGLQTGSTLWGLLEAMTDMGAVVRVSPGQTILVDPRFIEEVR